MRGAGQGEQEAVGKLGQSRGGSRKAGNEEEVDRGGLRVVVSLAGCQIRGPTAPDAAATTDREPLGQTGARNFSRLGVYDAK